MEQMLSVATSLYIVTMIETKDLIETCVIKNSILSVAFTNYQTQGPCCHLAVGGVKRTDTVHIRLFMGLGGVKQLIGYL